MISEKEAIAVMGNKATLRYFYNLGLIKRQDGLYSRQDCLRAPFVHGLNVECGRGVRMFRGLTIPKTFWNLFLIWRLKT